jgi:hypothetical protein
VFYLTTIFKRYAQSCNFRITFYPLQRKYIYIYIYIKMYIVDGTLISRFHNARNENNIWIRTRSDIEFVWKTVNTYSSRDARNRDDGYFEIKPTRRFSVRNNKCTRSNTLMGRMSNPVGFTSHYTATARVVVPKSVSLLKCKWMDIVRETYNFFDATL